MYDLIIIGGGVAGMTAAIYAARSGLSTLIIEKAGFGGQAALTAKIENYPSYKEIDGFQLAADDSYRGRHGSVLADRLLHAQCRLNVLRVRHTVTNNGRFECYARLACRQRRLHLIRYRKIFIHS